MYVSCCSCVVWTYFVILCEFEACLWWMYVETMVKCGRIEVMAFRTDACVMRMFSIKNT